MSRGQFVVHLSCLRVALVAISRRMKGCGALRARRRKMADPLTDVLVAGYQDIETKTADQPGFGCLNVNTCFTSTVFEVESVAVSATFRWW
jgi:hypothetical protein